MYDPGERHDYLKEWQTVADAIFMFLHTPKHTLEWNGIEHAT